VLEPNTIVLGWPISRFILMIQVAELPLVACTGGLCPKWNILVAYSCCTMHLFVFMMTTMHNDQPIDMILCTVKLESNSIWAYSMKT
jgi:hypothetical protein